MRVMVNAVVSAMMVEVTSIHFSVGTSSGEEDDDIGIGGVGSARIDSLISSIMSC
jgi:hypothetical protein